MSLATKYRPQDFTDVVEQNTIVNILSGICKQPEIENRNFLFIGPAGTGKAQPLYSKVLTPKGFKLMKDIEIGDEVITASGNVAVVDGVFPQGKRPIYEILLSDSTTIHVSDNHLNVVYTQDDSGTRVDHTLTTIELIKLLMESSNKIRIDIPSIDWPDCKVSLDPYLFGCLIGCGHISDNNISLYCSSKYIQTKIDKILRHDFNCKLYPLSQGSIALSNTFIIDWINRSISNTANPVLGIFKRLYCQNNESHSIGLADRYISELDICIPTNYLCNSQSVKLNFIQGLLDTCGYINVSGSLSFAIQNFNLSNQISDIIRSLGVRDNIKQVVNPFFCKYHERYIQKGMYNHTLACNDPLKLVSLNKLKSRITKPSHHIQRYIKSITYVREEECQCIHIDHEDHTYISDNFIPTHNTTLARIMANVLNNGLNNTIEIDAASHNGVDSVREIINQARMYPVGSKYKVFVIDECFPGSTLISTPEGNRYIKDIAIGDIVYSKNGLRKVSNKFRNIVKTDRLIKLRFSDDVEIVTTLDHRFYSDKGWIEAKNINVGDHVYTISESKSGQTNYIHKSSFLVESITYNQTLNPNLFKAYFSAEQLATGYVTMYDLEVDEDHCYFANNILVHNCHSFSNQAWQIWLKTLEDAPAKSIFIFCTTNPEKIPPTIISRVQTFQLSKISLSGIYNRLCYIIDKENGNGANITYTEDAVNFIAKLANGGMRDSITLLDKVLAFTHDLTSESVSVALGLPEYDDYFELLNAYAKKDNVTISKVINDVYNSGVNFVKWFEGFHSFVMNVVKYIFLKDINLTMIPSHYDNKISKYSTPHCIICLKLANKLISLNHELKSTQYLQEVALTYLCQIPKKGA